MDVNTIIMVEKKLSLEESTKDDLKSIEVMMELDLFQENVSWFQDFMSAINDLGVQELKSKMDVWKDEWCLKSMGEYASSDDELFPSISIPHAALERLFAPNPSYEITMQFASRGNALALCKTKNEFDWNQNNRSFELAGIGQISSLAYRFENNENQVIKEGLVEVSDGVFFLSLDLEMMLPGRYYLKLIIGNQMIMHSFFVQKNLLQSLNETK